MCVEGVSFSGSCIVPVTFSGVDSRGPTGKWCVTGFVVAFSAAIIF